VRNQALALVRLGDPTSGEVARSAVALLAKLNLPHFLSAAVLIFASAFAERAPQRALTLLGASDAMLESIESAAREPSEEHLCGDVRKLLELTLGHDGAEQALERGRALGSHDAVRYALETD
jgi:hypothetical protein